MNDAEMHLVELRCSNGMLRLHFRRVRIVYENECNFICVNQR